MRNQHLLRRIAVSTILETHLSIDKTDPPVPDGLGPTGTRRWTAVTDVYEDLSPPELWLLESAARQDDLIAELEAQWEELGRPTVAEGVARQAVAHPLVSELRQHRATLRQLVTAMKLPELRADDGPFVEAGSVVGSDGPMSRSASGRVAARARWDRNRGVG
jgi:hypothetical protein